MRRACEICQSKAHRPKCQLDYPFSLSTIGVREVEGQALGASRLMAEMTFSQSCRSLPSELREACLHTALQVQDQGSKRQSYYLSRLVTISSIRLWA